MWHDVSWLYVPSTPRYELELENEMRTFFRRYYTHSRYQSATQDALVQLNLSDKVRTE